MTIPYKIPCITKSCHFNKYITVYIEYLKQVSYTNPSIKLESINFLNARFSSFKKMSTNVKIQNLKPINQYNNEHKTLLPLSNKTPFTPQPPSRRQQHCFHDDLASTCKSAPLLRNCRTKYGKSWFSTQTEILKLPKSMLCGNPGSYLPLQECICAQLKFQDASYDQRVISTLKL